MRKTLAILFLPLYFTAMTEMSDANSKELATFAGGCFWCVVKPFHKYEGVSSVISGYTGGDLQNPTYQQVSTGKTGHVEAAQITFDPKRVTYADLLEGFWRVIDPTDGGGQFTDRGSHYRPAIFYHSEAQKKEAEASREQMAKSEKFRDKKIAVEILPAKKFYPAEEYHQDYYKKNPAHYERYFEGSGRKGFLERLWGR